MAITLLNCSSVSSSEYMFKNIFVKKQHRSNKTHFHSKMDKTNKNMLYQKSEKAEKATECSSSKQVFYNSVENCWKENVRKFNS